MRVRRKYFLVFILFLSTCGIAVAGDTMETSQRKFVLPEKRYGDLFYDVMNCDSLFGPHRLFLESKMFVDAVPKGNLDSILTIYHHIPYQERDRQLGNFLRSNFVFPVPREITNPGFRRDIDSYIKSLWSVLTCGPDKGGGTLIPLKHPYFIPGGRFREMYYWDSYFSMLGMLCDDEDSLVMDMLDNFADLINEFGFIPNGTRTYYLGRSQAPFFSFMVEDAAKKYGDGIYIKYLPELEKEYRFWMRGKDCATSSHPAYLRVVRMKDGELLNRYFDNYDSPREEMYRNDVAVGKELQRKDHSINVNKLYRNLRAAAESGYDFSSRWMEDGKNLYTIRTTDIVPVDLNCLVYHLEQILSKAYSLQGNDSLSNQYTLLASSRRKAIDKYFWSSADGFFKDYVWTTHRQSVCESLAGIYPLFCHVAESAQAEAVEKTIKDKFLKKGGVITTLYHTGQQWDAPNGWAPLQWITYKGLKNYGFMRTAEILRCRWMATCRKVYLQTGKLLEKYNVERQSDTGGGEYENQYGFGWTNGVYRAMETDR
jgi:alpha,alpha-trehalase